MSREATKRDTSFMVTISSQRDNEAPVVNTVEVQAPNHQIALERAIKALATPSGSQWYPDMPAVFDWHYNYISR